MFESDIFPVKSEVLLNQTFQGISLSLKKDIE